MLLVGIANISVDWMDGLHSDSDPVVTDDRSTNDLGLSLAGHRYNYGSKSGGRNGSRGLGSGGGEGEALVRLRVRNRCKSQKKQIQQDISKVERIALQRRQYGSSVCISVHSP